nr:MAG TPA: hypothetical protein [Caudoviricetes sp.]
MAVCSSKMVACLCRLSSCSRRSLMSSLRSLFCSFELLCSRTQPTIVTTSVKTNAASSTPCCENQSVMKTILRRIQ